MFILSKKILVFNAIYAAIVAWFWGFYAWYFWFLPFFLTPQPISTLYTLAALPASIPNTIFGLDPTQSTSGILITNFLSPFVIISRITAFIIVFCVLLLVEIGLLKILHLSVKRKR